jgi:hypothetical protein
MTISTTTPTTTTITAPAISRITRMGIGSDLEPGRPALTTQGWR